MKWSHIDLVVAASTGPAWWKEIEPFYGENRGEIGPDRRADRPMISPPCSSPEGSRGKPLASVFRYGKHNLLLLDPASHILPRPATPPQGRKAGIRTLDIFRYQVKYKAATDEAANDRLMKGLDGFLERDRDRALFDLPPKSQPPKEDPGAA